MQLVATQAVTPRVRDEKNHKFANDGSFESVDQLLHKLSIKCYARVQAMGLGMEFDDVLQEMRVNYVKARDAWKPDGGALFSTYCTTACLNNFNLAIKKMERQRTIGKIEVTDKGVELTEDGKVKYQRAFGMVSECEFATTDEDGFNAYSDTAAASERDQPDFRLERSQAMQENLACMSIGAKRLVALLLQSDARTEAGAPAPKLRDLAREAQLQGDELRRVKLEIMRKFGVTWF